MKARFIMVRSIGWLFALVIFTAFFLGGVFICVWLWNAIYELIMY